MIPGKEKIFEHDDKCYIFEKIKASCGKKSELIKEEK